jgi:hypothetical protein
LAASQPGVTRRAGAVSDVPDGFTTSGKERDMRVFVAGGTGVIGQHLIPALIAQSFTGFTNEYSGTLVKTEDDPLKPDPPASARQTLAAIRHVDETVPGAVPEGIVLR